MQRKEVKIVDKNNFIEFTEHEHELLNKNFYDKLKKELKNAKGKRLLEKTYLNYSLSIIELLKSNPLILDKLLESLELNEQDFYNYISGNIHGNITFYNEALKQVKILIKEK